MTGFCASYYTPHDCFNQKTGIGNFAFRGRVTEAVQETTKLPPPCRMFLE